MASRRRNLTVLLLSAFFACRLFAADEIPPVEFRVLSISDSVSFLFDEGKETRRLYTSPGYFSDWLEAPTNGNLVFYQEFPPPAGTEINTPKKQKLAETQLPIGQGPFLVLVQHASDGPELRTKVLDHSLDAFPMGQYRIINLSKRRMAINLASQNMLLEPGQTELTRYPSGRKTWLKVAVNDEKSGWIKVISKPRPVENTTRTSIIILDIPPTDADPNPIGVIVREARERINVEQSGEQSIM